MENFYTAKRKAAVLFIIDLILLALAAYFYVRLYNPFKSADGNLLEKVQANLLDVVVFLGLSVFWFILGFADTVKYTRIARYYGPFFGSFFAKLVISFEIIGYALFIAFLFV